MTSPRTAKWLRMFAAVTALAAGLALAPGTPGTSATPSSAAADDSRSRTFKLAPLRDSTQLPGPMRGQYRWLGADPKPATATANDVYYRDQVYWGRLERTDNAWDFTWIDAGLAAAAERGGKFGFRVMAYCPGCWMETRDDFPSVTPAFVPRQPGGYIPDWNSPTFLAQWRELMGELGRRYGNDPRLGYVDVGGYGSYGEWHVDTGEKIADRNALAVVRAVSAAFPRKHVLINTMTPVPFTLKALKKNANLGLRTDNLGCPDMYSTVPGDVRLQQVWKTRPFLSEWCTRPDPILGAKQARQFHISTLSSGNMPWSYESLTPRQRVAYDRAIAETGYRIRARSVTLPTKVKAGGKVTVRTSWVNDGTAPTYDSWTVKLVFVNAKTGETVTKPMGQPLRGLTSARRATATITTGGLARGAHQVYLAVTDPSGYAEPMHLANAGRTPTGSYRVGAVTVR